MDPFLHKKMDEYVRLALKPKDIKNTWDACSFLSLLKSESEAQSYVIPLALYYIQILLNKTEKRNSENVGVDPVKTKARAEQHQVSAVAQMGKELVPWLAALRGA